MRLLSLEGKLAAALGIAVVAAAALGAMLSAWLGNWRLAAVAAVLLLLVPALVLAHYLGRPVADLIRALSGSVTAFRDGDFSFSIASRRRDEVGDLVAAHNKLGRVLRVERQNLFQRELLLDTVVQNTPNALVLVSDAGRVVYSNLAARQLLNGGRTLDGETFGAILDSGPEAFARAIAAGEDSLFSVAIDGEEETFHLSQRRFTLQGRRHTLYLVRLMTREMSRQEVATWKKVIRVISHELNNSLGPIRSLSHSGRELSRRGDLERLGLVFDTIEERSRHLERFIQGYARFAKLPLPHLDEVDLNALVDVLAGHCQFVLCGQLPQEPARFDRAQIEQVLINLLKNAHEAGGEAAAVELEIDHYQRQLRILVRDRGPGMSETVLANALLPFYSTKRHGTGLGLALAREIAEAHGGRVTLANRRDGGLSVTLLLPE